MLDPRIYRMGFVAVALAVVVLAFSLVDQQGPLGSTLAPDAFSGQNAGGLMSSLARANPDRRPGSAGDEDVASSVAARLRQYNYNVSERLFRGSTVDGRRTLENVIGVRAGLGAGSIVVLSHRDSLHSPAPADLSGTATMLELARVLAGQTQHRTIVLVSTSGSAGMAGAGELARTLPEPIDAVIALGDVAGVSAHAPVVIPWSTGENVAPALLRNTVAAALTAQSGLRPGGAGLAGQLAHLAFPITLNEQAAFGAHGIPAVTLSLAGDHRVPASDPTSVDRLGAMGRSVLETVNALDGGQDVPRAAPYLLLSGKVVPAWAIRLLLLALLAPVVLVAADGLARARRRGYSISVGIARALAHGLPFLIVALLVIAVRLLGLLHGAPPGPVAAGEVPLRGGGIALLVGLVIVLAGTFPLVHRIARRSPSDGRGQAAAPDGPDPAQAIGTVIVMCLVALALWTLNPFAAILVIPALHLWLWLLDTELRPHPVLSVVLLALGVVPPVLVILDYARTLGLDPVEVIWNGLLLLAGGQLGIATVVAWALLLGCVHSVVVIAVQTLRRPRLEDAPVTVRGPVTYAGPGSLGGTESALRR
jgi:Peptidase family M28